MLGRNDPRSIEREVAAVLRVVAPRPQALDLFTDEHQDYPRALRRVPELDPHLLEHGVGVLLDQRQVLLGQHLERLQRARDVRNADRVRDGACGLPRGATAAAATAGRLGHVGIPIMRSSSGRARLECVGAGDPRTHRQRGGAEA